MNEILILACGDCDCIYEENNYKRCPLCGCKDYEIVDVEYE